MKILHLVSSIDPKDGGPTRSITGLCRGLAGCGVDAHLFSASPVHNFPNACGVKFYKGSGRGLLNIRDEVEKIIREIEPDVIHLHGLWMPVNHVFCGLTYLHHVPFVQSIRGMLDPWALKQKAFKKRIALLIYQRHDLKLAACLHATAEQEMRNIRAQGFLQPIVVIPNGVDLPDSMPSKTNRSDGRKIALFLSRLHPGKGLLDLVRAWAICKPSGWVVRVVGPDVCGHKAEVVDEVAKRDLLADFEFVGELNDSDKWQEYVNADLFVHPSHSENFGISIAEALAAGLPVIATKGTPWAELEGEGSIAACAAGSKVQSQLVPLVQGLPEVSTVAVAVGNGSRQFGKQCSGHAVMNFRTNELARTGRAGWWIDIGTEPLAAALREAMGLSDEERYAMGENGRRLVETKYTWPAITEQMKAAYEQVISRSCNQKESTDIKSAINRGKL